MTVEDLTDRDVSPSFVWSEKYVDQLQRLADTDEMTDDIHWPQLKDAIKHLLKRTFQQWPSTSAPILHPAATLIPLHSQSMDDSSSSSNHQIHVHAAAATNGNGVASTSAAARAPANGGDAQSSQGPQGQESLNDRFPHGSDDADGSDLGQDFSSVRESDMQAFFPSKRQAPAEWKGSWGKRIDTEEELKSERRTIFGMLDDFENQPPFTIQRLAEIILRPTEHHHTLPKYVGALKRLLSVTATRDAFPAHPGDAEEDQAVDNTADDVAMTGSALNGNADVSTRTASVRSRTSSIPGSPSTAPLFSPIPFLMRSGDEGMPGAGPVVGGPGVDTGEGLSSDSTLETSSSDDFVMADRDVPGMELGGADRTTEAAIERAKQTGKGVGGSKSVSDAASEIEARLVNGDGSELDKDATNVSASTHEQSEIARGGTIPVSTTNESVSLTSSVESTAADAATTSSTTKSEPLGVPAGMVDEVDQIGEKHGQLPPLEPGAVAGGAKAFSSTTTTTPSHAADAIQSDASKLPSDQPSKQLEDEQSPSTRRPDAESTTSVDGDERALKRVRSERNLNAKGEK